MAAKRRKKVAKKGKREWSFLFSVLGCCGAADLGRGMLGRGMTEVGAARILTADGTLR